MRLVFEVVPYLKHYIDRLMITTIYSTQSKKNYLKCEPIHLKVNLLRILAIISPPLTVGSSLLCARCSGILFGHKDGDLDILWHFLFSNIIL